ncbi:ferredoxin reductase family protein [Roseomonas sp. CAU 1739]|uniref:ferredoxin reductase family protein n=1 Tax=Roseomonas sp. CAU 1739 TaxID=3140364 RepID=UPI00325A63DF
MPAIALITVMALAIAAPLGLGWAFGGPVRPWRDELAGGLAMAGTAALLSEFLLSGRFRMISGRIGIDRTMRWHQLLARVLTVGLLVHPFLYTLPDASQFVRPGDPTRAGMLGIGAVMLATGALAWLGLGVLTITAIARDALPWRYEAWRLGHGLGAALVAGLGLAHALTGGRYSALPAVAASWAVLAGLAGASLASTYLIRPLLLARRPWRVAAVQPAAERCWEVVLEPLGHEGLRFRAGQFAWLRLDRPALSRREHPFSIASAPGGDGSLSFLVKQAGDFTNDIGALRPGARAFVDGPHGHLTIDGRREPGVCLIGGGVGVAPLLSILRAARARRDPRPFLLLYGNRHQGQVLAGAELDAMAQEIDLTTEHVLQEPPSGWSGARGMVDRALVAQRCAGAAREGWVFVLCGPPPMMREVRGGLAALGVPSRRILEERFTYD